MPPGADHTRPPLPGQLTEPVERPLGRAGIAGNQQRRQGVGLVFEPISHSPSQIGVASLSSTSTVRNFTFLR